MKKSTGTSFNKYLSDIKIRKVIAYYKHTSLSQEEIINLLFIKDEKVFTDKIKNIQRLKEEFADKPKVYSILNKVTSLTYIFNYNPSDKSTTKNVTENKIHISNGESSNIFPVWKQLINLGYAVYFDNRQTFNQLITLMENRMKLLQKSLAAKRIKTELWITEFNSNLSSRNLINDSSYQATFIAKTILAAARQKIRGAGYYLMSDEPLRYADTAKFLFGGWGLFTDKSSPKPSFHALSMLSRLGTKLEKLSDKYIVTSKPDGSFQILIYHYEHLTEEYCDKNASVQDFSYPEKIFVKNNADSWNITFSDIPSGYYLIKEYSVTPVKGNILYQWSNLHFIMPIKEETQKTLEKLSSITPALSCVRVTPDIPLTLNYILSRQHLKLITVQRQNTTDDYERNINHD